MRNGSNGLKWVKMGHFYNFRTTDRMKWLTPYFNHKIYLSIEVCAKYFDLTMRNGSNGLKWVKMSHFHNSGTADGMKLANPLF